MENSKKNDHQGMLWLYNKMGVRLYYGSLVLTNNVEFLQYVNYVFFVLTIFGNKKSAK